MTSVAVINGPNLNLLGTRKPEVYGSTTLADVEQMCRDDAEALGLTATFRQSNHEGQIVDWIHEIGASVKSGESIGAVYNPGAHTHYSYAIRDAIEGASLPVIETAHFQRACARGVAPPLGDLAACPGNHRRIRGSRLLPGHQRHL
jgi:3-dehydroquinate dehydratase-2